MSAEWQFLVTLNEQLRPLRDAVAIQEVAVRLVCDHFHASRVNFAYIDGDEFVISQSYAEGIRPFTGRGPLARFGKAIVEACRRGETVTVENVQRDPRFTDAERERFLAAEIAALVGVPIIKDGRWLATFGVHTAAPRNWTRDQVALIEVTAERTWAAAERGRAEEALGRSESRQAFLRRLHETIRPLANPACILSEVCRLLGTYLRVNRVSYGEIEGDECVIIDQYVDGLPRQARRFPWRSLGGSRTADILKGATLSINDTSAEVHTADERAALQAAGIGAYICPLLIKDGRFVAAFGIHSRVPRVWTPDEMALVQEVADRIWVTLEHRRAEAGLRANQERLAFLLRLNDALRPLSDPGDVQETAARLLGEHLGATRVGYAEVENRDYVIRREYSRGVAPLVGLPSVLNVGEELRAAFRQGEVVVVTDVQTDPRLGADERANMHSRQIAAFIGVTLFKHGHMVAAFGASQDTPRLWTASEVELVSDVAERTWDAVERSRAETALRAQKQRLQLALEASAGGSWTWIAETNQVDWDERFRALYGFTPEEPASSGAWLTRVHEEDRPQVAAHVDGLLTSRSKDSWEIVFRILRPDGTVGWIQSRGRAERADDGTLTRLTGLDLDFSQHRHAEEAVQLRRDEEHNRALRTLLETATQGIVSVDPQGVIVSANRALEMMFGWEPGELIGQPIERLMPSAFCAAHVRHRTSYFAAPHARLMGGLHLVGERSDGSTFPIEVTLNHVPTPGGGRAFAFVTDITDRQHAAVALRERTAELEYRTTQLSRMASDLTLAEQHAREQIARTLHDGLQQLLAIAALDLEQQLKRERELGAAPSELLSEAQHHLKEAIAAARSLSIELYPPVLQRSGLPAALMWLANWTRDKYKVEVRVVADPHADSARKEVRTLLFESVRELLFNAIKHAQADHVTLELALDADDQLCITVTDQGIGFEPSRLDDRSKSGQIGWGLFSIRERLTLFGGRFEIDSAPGRGTRVRLVAPRGAGVREVAAAEESILAPVGAASPGDNGGASPGALRILIADDHPAVRSALRKMLHARPELSVVGEASNGFEAIAHASRLRPDVILMDVAMPYMDGIEATARIRAELPEIRVLGLSMQPRTGTAHAIEQAGAAGFFAKGTDTERLLDHLLAFHHSRGACDSAAS